MTSKLSASASAEFFTQLHTFLEGRREQIRDAGAGAAKLVAEAYLRGFKTGFDAAKEVDS